jgi:hypothetical protein
VDVYELLEDELNVPPVGVTVPPLTVAQLPPLFVLTCQITFGVDSE